MKKNMLLLCLLLGLSIFIVACGGGSNTSENESTDNANNNADNNAEEEDVEASGSSGDEFTFKVGHSLTEDHPYHLALEQFNETVSEKTDGAVGFEIYPLSQLGAERECIESLTVGTVDMCVSSTAPMVNFYSPIGLLDLPFLFEDREEAYKVLDGEVGDDLFEGLKDQGIIGLAWAENGFRHITNSKHEVTKPEDLDGLKIRVQESPLILDAFEALGAQPTPMAWDEALTALQQGVVDAQENPVTVAVNYKLMEANQKYMTLTGHIYSPAAFLFSDISWEQLPEDYQTIIQDAAQEAGDYERNLIAEQVDEGIEELKDQGMEIVEEVDKAPFREAVQPVYDKYGEENKELLDKIEANK